MADTGELWRKIGDLERALHVAQMRNDAQQEANILMLLGGYYCALLQWTDARASFEKAIALLRNLPSAENQAHALYGLGLALGGEQRYSEALPVLEEALQRARAGQQEEYEIGCLTQLGHAATEAGKPELAVSYLQEVLVLVRRQGDRKAEGRELGQLGTALALLKREQEAMACHEQALTIARELGDQAGVAMELGNLGYMLTDHLGQPERAIDYFQQALAAFRQLQDRRSAAKTLKNIAAAYLLLHQPGEALQLLEQARAEALALGDRALLGGIAGKEGEAYEQLGDPMQAILAHQRALLLDKGIGERRNEIEDMSNMGFALRTQGQPDEALHLHQQALVLARKQNDRLEEAQQLGNIASALQALGRAEEGVFHNHLALSLFRDLGNLVGEARTLINLGTTYIVDTIEPGQYAYRGQKSIAKGLAYWRLGQEFLEIDLPVEAGIVQQKIEGIGVGEDAQSIRRRLRASEVHFRWLHLQRFWPAGEEPVIREQNSDNEWYRSSDQAEDLASLLDEQPLQDVLEMKCSLSSHEWQRRKETFQAAIARALDTQDHTLHSRLLYALGYFCAALGEQQNAIVNFQQAIQIGRTSRDLRRTSQAALLLGTLLFNMGQPMEAIAAFEQGSFLLQHPEDRSAEHLLFRSMCALYRKLGLAQLAKGLLEEELAFRTPLDGPVEKEQVLLDLGLTCLELGHPQKALEYLGQAKELVTGQRDVIDEGKLLCLLATTYAVRGKYTAARTSFLQAQELFDHHEDLVNAGQVSIYIALTYLLQEHMPLCLAHLRKGLDLTGEHAPANKRAKQLLQQIEFAMRRDAGTFQALWEESSPHYATLQRREQEALARNGEGNA